jgi:hypothetical protein
MKVCSTLRCWIGFFYSTFILGSVITPPPSTAAAQPDLNHVHSLMYSHGSLSIDQPDIMLDGVMLKQVSSTTQDQTIAAIQALNTLLTQVGTTQARWQKLCRFRHAMPHTPSLLPALTCRFPGWWT